ncbi:MAG TPA: diguanylate cyclase [Candidatus Acidoferrales bacterium]|jgi:diguanylate cyclase (GGDEF)-like protein/PAS domain S-box-containing protein|nr:diguanylate cyclase [Candidatus Acidoferrales bacterium]
MKRRSSKRPGRQKIATGNNRTEEIHLLAQAVENCSDMIGMANPEGYLTFMNRTFLQALGYSREEFVGKHFGIAFAPNNPPGLVQEIGEKSVQDGGWRGECLSLRRDGSTFTMLLSVGPVKDENGRVIGSFGVGQDISSRQREAEALREAHENLRAALEESEQRARESAKITELIDILQSCQTVEEAYEITGNAVPAILSSRSGALCITSASRNIVEAVVTWGDAVATERTFAPDSCWALRRGRVHRVDDSSSPMRCSHVSSTFDGGYVCVPLAAQGETLGVLSLGRVPAGPNSSIASVEQGMETLSRQGGAVGERISLALANLRLREVLRSQSIRDPLTGLFNRRYMEESLERELRRAVRSDQCVSLIMMDIDHFKRFNDTFGHQAGDTLLRVLGDFLSQRTRGQDVACRFGGEEFALILAGASSDDGYKRAELLREELKQLTVNHAGRVLGKITFSIGISAFPGHGTTAEQLLHFADQALYLSKTEGRDRSTIAAILAEAHEKSPVAS